MVMQTDIDKIDSYLAHLTVDARAKLTKYYETLLTFNAKVNLVSTSTAPFSAKQHFADSVYGLDICSANNGLNGEVYDFGSGNGFPGLVLGVIRPDLQVHLVERDTRKSEFMKYTAGELGLKNIHVYPNPMETLPKGSVLCGVTRALGSLATLLIQMNTLFPKGGTLYHFKTDTWTSELANCPTQVFTHWDIQPVGQYTLPDSAIVRYIISSKKIS
jgi:16S rRNA (guanine527-N7)-methyltransferase